MDYAQPVAGAGDPIRVERWPTEMPLLVLVALGAAAIWVLLAVTIIGALYAVMIGVLLMASHLGFIAYVRGSAVRLGPGQFPELHQRVAHLARAAGLSATPEVYLLQAGGALNAMATRFLRSRLVILYTDLLEACGDNTAARDMVIGHEIGHIRAGHLRWTWFLFPGFLIPLLGTAYSRAREYTCDRWGEALCGDPDAALVGLAVLAAGRTYGPQVNLAELARQKDQLNTGWMTLGMWLGTHPPLSMRIAALRPALVAGGAAGAVGPARAAALVAALVLTPMLVLAMFAPRMARAFREQMERAQAQAQMQAQTQAPTSTEHTPPADISAAAARARSDMLSLGRLAREHARTAGGPPPDDDALYDLWKQERAADPVPIDPFDGHWYGYHADDDGFVLWSAGPDGKNNTDDDIVVDSDDLRPTPAS